MTKTTLLAAAGLFTLAANAATACNTFDAGTAFIHYRADGIDQQTKAIGGGTVSQADVHESFARMERRVVAAVATCKRGEVISIPQMFVNRYCDFGKHVEHERGGMVSCVKAK